MLPEVHRKFMQVKKILPAYRIIKDNLNELT